jgi:hypothetical protein
MSRNERAGLIGEDGSRKPPMALEIEGRKFVVQGGKGWIFRHIGWRHDGSVEAIARFYPFPVPGTNPLPLT